MIRVCLLFCLINLVAGCDEAFTGSSEMNFGTFKSMSRSEMEKHFATVNEGTETGVDAENFDIVFCVDRQDQVQIKPLFGEKGHIIAIPEKGGHDTIDSINRAILEQTRFSRSRKTKVLLVFHCESSPEIAVKIANEISDEKSLEIEVKIVKGPMGDGKKTGQQANHQMGQSIKWVSDGLERGQ